MWGISRERQACDIPPYSHTFMKPGMNKIPIETTLPFAFYFRTISHTNMVFRHNSQLWYPQTLCYQRIKKFSEFIIIVVTIIIVTSLGSWHRITGSGLDLLTPSFAVTLNHQQFKINSKSASTSRCFVTGLNNGYSSAKFSLSVCWQRILTHEP
jgi:hypothetical protein